MTIIFPQLLKSMFLKRRNLRDKISRAEDQESESLLKMQMLGMLVFFCLRVDAFYHCRFFVKFGFLLFYI